jgi:hypothetical protein
MNGAAPLSPWPSAANNGTHKPGENDEIPPYTIGDHIRHVHLKSEEWPSSSGKTKTRYHYCDVTQHFVQEAQQRKLVQDVVKEYCRPFSSFAELQDMWVGMDRIEQSASQTNEPLAFRTLSIRIRPDCLNETVMISMETAFRAVHHTHRIEMQRTGQLFQAIGADGTVPYLINAQLCMSKDMTLDRQLVIRFFHTSDIMLMEEDLQIVGGLPPQKSPLAQGTIPVNTQLQEACALVQLLASASTNKETPAPCPTQAETSEHLRSNHMESSWGVQDENLRCSMKPQLPRRALFPSLSRMDSSGMQESYPLIFRIFSELEMAKCTYNTLAAEETCQFGMRPCHKTLDKHYCSQMSQVSQQRMLLELMQGVEDADQYLHETNNQYNAFVYLVDFALRKCFLLLPPDNTTDDEKMNAPIKLPNHPDFPWSNNVTKALQDVSKQFINEQSHHIRHDALKAKKISLALVQACVQDVYQAFCAADDQDQMAFLKEMNKKNMLRLVERQKYLLQVVTTITKAKTPQAVVAADHWYEIAQKATNRQGRPNSIERQVPLLEFETFSGMGCVTATSLIVSSKVAFLTKVAAFDLQKVDVLSSKNAMTKMSVSIDGRKVYGFNPSVGADELVEFLQVLTSVHG